MDFTLFFIEEKYLQPMGWTLAHSIWQILLISLLLWSLLKVIPKKASNIRYATALSALVLICSVSCWTFFHHLNQFDNSPVAISSTIEENFQETDTNNSIQALKMQSVLDNRTLSSLLSFEPAQYLPYLVNLWMLGALFYLVKFLGSLYDLKQLHKKHHEPVSQVLRQKVDNLTASLGIFKKIKVLKSSIIHVPVTYGLIKPIILLPTSLVLSIHPAQLEAIIAHELAHIKRYDYLANIFQSALEVVYFFHPAFWWINRIVHEERENATDDLALAIGVRPQDLAYSLAEVANHSAHCPPELSLAAANSKNPTLQRIRRILGRSTPQHKLSPLMPTIMILTLIISTMLIVGANTHKVSNRIEQNFLTQLNQQAFQFNITPPLLTFDEMPQTAQDTVPSKKTEKGSQGSNMPTLELSPLPEMDFDFDFPPLELSPPVPPMNIEFTFPTFEVRIIADSIGKVARELEMLKEDNTPEAQSKTERLESIMARLEQTMEAVSRTYERKMEIWQEKHGDSMEKFEEQMKKWEEKFEEHQKSWEASFAPKMKEFEKKMEQWEKENAPRIKEFEKKMEQWEKENAPRFKELEDKMENRKEENREKTNSSNKSTDQKGFINLNDYLKSNKTATC